MIICTNLIPKGFSAFSLWPFIFVRPEHRSDIALIEHEFVHYREQAWIMPVWVLLYLASRKFRLAAEVRAYTRQIEVGGVWWSSYFGHIDRLLSCRFTLESVG